MSPHGTSVYTHAALVSPPASSILYPHLSQCVPTHRLAPCKLSQRHKAASLLPQLLPPQLPQCSTRLTKVYPQDVSVSFLTATVSCRLSQCPHPTLTLCPPQISGSKAALQFLRPISVSHPQCLAVSHDSCLGVHQLLNFDFTHDCPYSRWVSLCSLPQMPTRYFAVVPHEHL